MRDQMTSPDLQHLTADELDALLDANASERATSHLATCRSCLAMFELDRRLVTSLAALPSLSPSADFEQLVMSRVTVAPTLVPTPATSPSPREIAARRRVVVGALLTGGSLVAGFAWAFANPAAALGAVAPVLRETGDALWVSMQTIASNATEQPWFGTFTDALGSPAKVLLAMAAVGALYVVALTGFRRLLTDSAADARW